MINTNSNTIFVNGAGIAGLTSALALADKGFTVYLLEKSKSFEPLGAGLQLSSNALVVLEQLGLGCKIKHIATQPDGIILTNGVTGRELARIELGEAILRKFRHPYLVVHRADLQSMLFDQCQNHEPFCPAWNVLQTKDMA